MLSANTRAIYPIIPPERLELSRSYEHWNLSPTCLPIPPRGHFNNYILPFAIKAFETHLYSLHSCKSCLSPSASGLGGRQKGEMRLYVVNPTSFPSDSNRQPTDYKSVTLPLRQRSKDCLQCSHADHFAKCEVLQVNCLATKPFSWVSAY